MRRYVVVLAGVVMAGALVAGCGGGGDGSEDSDSGPETMTVGELEELVTGSVTPDDESAEVSAECEGGIDVEVDAGQDCRVLVGEETADIHFVVTEVDDGSVADADFTPYVPGDRLAPVIQEQLGGQVPGLGDVRCDEELPGEADATTTCTATAGGDELRVQVDVTEVEGLFINFRMRVVE